MYVYASHFYYTKKKLINNKNKIFKEICENNLSRDELYMIRQFSGIHKHGCSHHIFKSNSYILDRCKYEYMLLIKTAWINICIRLIISNCFSTFHIIYGTIEHTSSDVNLHIEMRCKILAQRLVRLFKNIISKHTINSISHKQSSI